MSRNPEVVRAIDKAIEIAGSQVKLAFLTGYTQNGIHQAKLKGRVSGEMAARIAAATGVSKQKLAPQIFGAAPRETVKRLAAEAAG